MNNLKLIRRTYYTNTNEGTFHKITGLSLQRDSLVAQLVKNTPAMGETWVQSLGWEDPLEKGTAPLSSILAWRIPWTVESMGCKELDTLQKFSKSKTKTELFQIKGY